jgi:hypothetical protein
MAAMMNADVVAACGPKGEHDLARTAVRHGREDGSVTLGGRRVPVQRPRMRATDGSGELPVPTYELFSRTEVLGRMAMERMLAGLSTRRYPVGLEPVGQRTERAARSMSKSAVSRRFVAATETALGELLAAPLDELDLVALMIDGVHFGDHLCAGLAVQPFLWSVTSTGFCGVGERIFGTATRLNGFANSTVSSSTGSRGLLPANTGRGTGVEGWWTWSSRRPRWGYTDWQGPSATALRMLQGER